GIRDFHVTGVQTCALPISSGDAGDIESITAYLTPSGTRAVKFALYHAGTDALVGQTEEISVSGSAGWFTANFTTPVAVAASTSRSEERRVGKEEESQRSHL